MVLDWDQTLKLVKQQRGKVVVLDIWNTDCLPCLKEFPNLVALQEAHPDDVVAIGFNTNYQGIKSEPPESFRETVRTFVESKRADFPNVLSSVPDLELYDKLGIGGPPVVYVFDREGRQAKRFDNEQGGEEFTYEKDIVPFVEALISSDKGE
ncbi:MAG: TlpA family protein disulfide reductase [Planctomycetes bacterium]|nr:TlpA family protein disulfide reductase [Planctomycetota bacterium]